MKDNLENINKIKYIVGMTEYIEPRVLKGFRDFLPSTETARRELIEKIEASFRSFGFVPIDTPALEYADILLGKGGGETEKQIYRFKDNGGRDVALRFDLTVPFARFTAQHKSELVFPFKRYHIAKVWRGENTQRGRYREFTQCDFDIIGSDSAASDFEILLLIHTALKNLGIGITIHINHRGLFNRFLSGIGQNQNSTEILRAVDKLSKAGEEETRKNLTELAGVANADKILEFIGAKGSFTEVIERITELAEGSLSKGTEIERLSSLRAFMIDAAGSSLADQLVLAPSITRGLDYYTGVVFETFLNDMPEIGSICSGGRYDDLSGLYSKQGSISGVGSSIGLDRLLAALEALGKLPKGNTKSAAIACIDINKSGQYQALAARLRAAGIACEVFLDEAQSASGAGNEKNLVKQYQLAEKKGLRWVIIPGNNSLALRDLANRKNTELSLDDIIKILTAKNANE